MVANNLLAGVAEAAPFLWPSLSIVLGLVFGSFLGCALYRVPRGLSLWSPPSQCPSCHARLQVLDLVPVFSWVFARGRCRHCGVAVSPFYTGIEAAMALLFLLAYFVTGPQLAWLPLAVAIGCAVFVTMILQKNHATPIKTLVFGLFALVVAVALWR